MWKAHPSAVSGYDDTKRDLLDLVSGYYTYLWSLVIAKDLFSRFERDLMDGATAGAYRASVLEPGGSKDARELVRDFLGREYDFESFERWLAR